MTINNKIDYLWKNKSNIPTSNTISGIFSFGPCTWSDTLFNDKGTIWVHTIPSISDIENKPTYHSFTFEDTKVIVTDLRLFLSELMNSSLRSLEVLSSSHHQISNSSLSFYNSLFKNKHFIAKSNLVSYYNNLTTSLNDSLSSILSPSSNFRDSLILSRRLIAMREEVFMNTTLQNSTTKYKSPINQINLSSIDSKNSNLSGLHHWIYSLPVVIPPEDITKYQHLLKGANWDMTKNISFNESSPWFSSLEYNPSYFTPFIESAISLITSHYKKQGHKPLLINSLHSQTQKMFPISTTQKKKTHMV